MLEVCSIKYSIFQIQVRSIIITKLLIKDYTLRFLKILIIIQNDYKLVTIATCEK